MKAGPQGYKSTQSAQRVQFALLDFPPLRLLRRYGTRNGSPRCWLVPDTSPAARAGPSPARVTLIATRCRGARRAVEPAHVASNTTGGQATGSPESVAVPQDELIAHP